MGKKGSYGMSLYGHSLDFMIGKELAESLKIKRGILNHYEKGWSFW